MIHPIPTFPVIIGPTAAGKSGFAVELCLAIASRTARTAEIVTADSMQVYRRMDIGTAKPTPEERQGVAHHLIDLVDPTESFTLDQWLKRAETCIADIRARGSIPVVVGGTNLYVKALLEGLFEGPAADEALRAELAAMDPALRRAELERTDPEAATRIHFNDLRRTVRALEVFRLTGKPISAHQRQWGGGSATRPDALVVALEWPTDLINRRINARVKQMAAEGLVEEVRALLADNAFGPQSREALGYKQLIEALATDPSPSGIDRALERIKIETRRFAKNQRTWLKRFREINGSIWLDGPDALTPAATDRVLDRLGLRSQ